VPHWWLSQLLPRYATQSAVLLRHVVCLSVCLSVSLSVTLIFRDHIGWNSSKIISQLVSLGVRFQQTPTARVLQRELMKFWPELGVDMEKSGFRHTKALQSLKRDKIGPRVILQTNSAFDCCRNQRPWMTLKGHHALCFKVLKPDFRNLATL